MTTTPLPPIPANTPHLTRRIRACESEVPAQVVLEHVMQAYATQARADLEAENARLKAVLKDVGLFLHHCWCDVQMNDYSFERLNRQMEAVDAALKETP